MENTLAKVTLIVNGRFLIHTQVFLTSQPLCSLVMLSKLEETPVGFDEHGEVATTIASFLICSLCIIKDTCLMLRQITEIKSTFVQIQKTAFG